MSQQLSTSGYHTTSHFRIDWTMSPFSLIFCSVLIFVQYMLFITAIIKNPVLRRYDVIESKVMIWSWNWELFQAIMTQGDWQIFLCFLWKLKIPLATTWLSCDALGYLHSCFGNPRPGLLTVTLASEGWGHLLSQESSRIREGIICPWHLSVFR